MTIKVVRGNPTPEELAAALAVVRARAAAASAMPPGAPGTPDAWADPARIAAHRPAAAGPDILEPHLLAGAEPEPVGPRPWRRQVEYAYSGAPPRQAHDRDMLWSDPENEPPKELRDAQQMLRRLRVLMALAMVLAMIVLGVR